MAAVVPVALGAVAPTAMWANVPWWRTYPHDDMTDTGDLVVGIPYQPLALWGPYSPPSPSPTTAATAPRAAGGTAS